MHFLFADGVRIERVSLKVKLDMILLSSSQENNA